MSLKQLTKDFLEQRQQLMAYVNGMVRDPDLSDDIVQTVWLKLAEAQETGLQIENVSAWSIAVARNLILEHWRKQKSSKVVCDERVLELAELAFEENDISNVWSARRAKLSTCIETLPERPRQILLMKYWRKTKVREIAIAMNLTELAVFKALSRVRQSLADCVAGGLLLDRRDI